MAASREVTCFGHFVIFLSLISLITCNGAFITPNGTILTENGSEYKIDFDPPSLEDLIVGVDHSIYFNVSLMSGVGVGGDTPTYELSMVRVQVEDTTLATVKGQHQFLLSEVLTSTGDMDNISTSFVISALFLGRTHMSVDIVKETITYDNIDPRLHHNSLPQIASHENERESLVATLSDGNHDNLSEYRVEMSLIRKERVIDHVFIGAVAVLVFLTNIGMGCKVDLDVVKEVMRRPIAPSIGFCCQFIIMPLTSFAVVYLLRLEGGVALGMFAAGCAPGGSGSNMYTFLLNGDVSLSVTMTFISVIASFAMIPFWMYTLGRLLTNPDSNLTLPIQNILITLVCLIIPVGIGILIRKKKPSVADKLIKLLKPFAIVFILFMFTFGVYTNLYVFKLITPSIIVAGCLLPYLGFILGGLVALACKQPWYRVYTIAIETGLQNTGIPILLMKFSLGQPEADMSIVSPIVMSMFTPIPLWFAIAVYEGRKCFKKSQKGAVVSEDIEEDEEQNNDDNILKTSVEKSLLAMDDLQHTDLSVRG